MIVTLKLFGSEARRAGQPSISIQLPDHARAADLLRALPLACPALAPAAHCRLAINHAFANPLTPISPSDELALIGLVSGG